MSSNFFDLAENALSNVDGDIVLAKGTSVPSSAAGYMIGCLFMKTDGGVGTSLYVNEGTTTTSDFNAISSSTSSTKYDDIGDPDADSTIAFAAYKNTWTSTLDSGVVFTISNTDVDLAADTILIDLKFKDAADANGIFLRCFDNTGGDAQFVIGADGNTVITGTASGTDALTLTTGDITVTAGDVTMTLGDLLLTAGDFTMTVGDIDVVDGKFDWINLVDEIAATWSFAGVANNDINWASSVTTGACLAITADALASTGDMVLLDSLGLPSGAYYIRCFDGVADDFSVGVNGNVTTTGTVNIATDSVNLTLGASGATDSYINFNSSDLVFFDSTLGVEKTLTQLAQGLGSNPVVSGDLTITDGKFTWTNASDEAAGAWTFAGTSNNDITWSSAMTTANVLEITANDLTSGSMIYLASSDANMAGEYIRCFDGSADDFTVGEDGRVTIAGPASGTDAIAITQGDITSTAGHLIMTLGNATLTDGNLLLSLGNITVANTADEVNKISRNNATGTNAVLEIEQTHTDGGMVLLIDQNEDSDVDAISVTNDGLGFALSSTGAVAGSRGFEFISATSGTETGLLLDGASGGAAWVGKATTGFANITSDGTLANASASLLRVDLTGGAAAASATGACAAFIDNASAGSGYSVYIASSGNLEALHVDDGEVVFDEQLTVSDDVVITVANSANVVALTVTNSDIANNSDGINISLPDTNTGRGLFIDHNDTGAGKALVIDSEAVSGINLEIDAVMTSNAVIDVANVPGGASTAIIAKFANTGGSASTGSGVLVDHDGATGAAIEIDRDGNNAADVIGFELNVDNAGAGDNVAMNVTLVDETKSYFAKFANTVANWNSTIDPSATAENGWIKIDVNGTPFFIPFYAAS